MKLTLWEQHKETWKNCQRCFLCHKRSKVVLGRGSIPANVVFIGEGPGHGEDTTGYPFKGPAGHVLDEIISRSIPRNLTYAITNLIACIPLGVGEEEGKTDKPPEESVLACTPRLQEFIRIADGPNENQIKLIVCVGNDPRDWLNPYSPEHIRFHRWISRIHIMHPSAMLRRNYALRMDDIQQAINNIARTTEEIVAGTYVDKLRNVITAPQLRSKMKDSQIPF